MKRLWTVAFLGVTAASCGGLRLGSRAPDPARPQPAGAPRREAPTVTLDAVDFYRRMGLIAQGVPLPFVGSASFAASARRDSTHVLFALALSSGALAFRREGDHYRADYRATIALKRADTTFAHVEATETVRVATIRETERSDESVLFQQLLTVAPGTYTLTVTLRDEGSTKSASTEHPLKVPSFDSGSMLAPLPFYEAQPRRTRDSLPLIVANPGAIVTYGRDSTVAMYLEAYGGNGPVSLGLAIQVENATVWTDSVPMTAAGDGLYTAIARVPIASIGIGSAYVAAWRKGGTDTAKTPIFVGLGDEIPTTTYEDMLSYLRYFASAARLRVLQGVAPAGRGAAWAAFYSETDPSPATRENAALRNYLVLLRQANAAFPEAATPGWRTDRGMVWLLLGPPDQVIDPFGTDATQRGRSLLWEYRSLNLNVEFIRTGAIQQWRLTQASEADVRAAARRLTGAGG